jgi:hypothetical protein
MRAFEFHAGEVDDKDVKLMIVDLDSVVMLKEWLSTAGSYTADTRWVVTLSSGDHLFVTKPAFDRILLAWKSK